MKIVQVNSVYGFGSTGSIVANLHENYIEKGIESYVFFSRKDTRNYTCKHVEKFYSNIGLLNHVGRALLFDKHGLYSDSNTYKIIESIERIIPDIVHLHNIHGFYLNYEILFAFLKRNNIKVVWTLHDCWAFTGYCSHFEFNNCYKWLTGCSRCKFRNVYPYRILSNSENNYKRKTQSYNDLDLTIVVPSKWLKNQVSQSILKSFPCYIINNGINFKNINANSKNQDNFTILAVSNIWSKQKGLYEYIDLSKKLKNNQRLIIVGLSKKQMKLFGDNVKKYERVEQDVLKEIYMQANLFLNLTLEDTFPTVNIEALSFGCPVIAYDSGGSSEVITSNTGIVIEKYDLEKVIETIDEIQKGSIVFNENDCIERSKVFSLENMVDNYVKLYSTLHKDK